MTEDKTPQEIIKSVQYDLFSQFISNDKNIVSNAIEMWESIPKYFLTPNQATKLRTSKGHADPYKWLYHYNGTACGVKIQPALIEQSDGSYKAYFPGATEELVEEALKKILTDMNYGIHDPNRIETWVRFTLSIVQRELKMRGRSRNRNEIKHAIEVMSKCVISFYKEDKEVWSGAILQDLVTVGRSEYLADTDAQHVARLPLFISHSINSLEYLQFNYSRLMSCNSQLTRWIYKQLVNKYRYASILENYHFMFSSLKQNSGLLQQERDADNRKKVIAALDELVQREVLHDYDVDVRKKGRVIIDVKYTVRASREFTAEQKAMNKRKSENEAVARKTRIKSLPRSR